MTPRCERCGRRGATYAARVGTRIIDVCLSCWRHPEAHPADLADERCCAVHPIGHVYRCERQTGHVGPHVTKGVAS